MQPVVILLLLLIVREELQRRQCRKAERKDLKMSQSISRTAFLLIVLCNEPAQSAVPYRSHSIPYISVPVSYTHLNCITDVSVRLCRMNVLLYDVVKQIDKVLFNFFFFSSVFPIFSANAWFNYGQHRPKCSCIRLTRTSSLLKKDSDWLLFVSCGLKQFAHNY